MKQVNLAVFDEVISRVKEMLPDGTKVAIVGGAVRDHLLGVPCKDIDVSIILYRDYEYIYGLALDIAEKLDADIHGFRGEYGGASGTDEDMSDFQLRLHGCLKVEMCGYNVDLLFQRDANNFEEVVKEYDHVANMLYYTPKQGFVRGISANLIDYYLEISNGFNSSRAIRDCRIDKMDRYMLEHSDKIKDYLGV